MTKLGFCHIPRWTMRETVDLLKDAESWGYDTGWLPDQAFYHDPYTILTAAAWQTKTLRLGVGVTNAFASHPLISARIAATVSDAADGRFVLGLGTGSPKDYLAPLGFSAAHGAERCRDALKVMRTLLKGDVSQYRSDYFVADEAKLSVKPRFPLPLYIGGVGPKILGIAGEYADGIILNLASAKSIRTALDAVALGRARRSEALGSPEVVAWGFLSLTEDRAAAYDRYRPFIAYAIEITHIAALTMLGFEKAAVDKVRTLYREGGGQKAAPCVTDEMVDNWMWIGSAEQIADQMQALRALGVSEIVVLPWTADLSETRSTVRGFIEHAAPTLSQPAADN